MPRSSWGHLPSGAFVNTFECVAQGRQAEIETARAVRAFANTMPAFGGLRGRKALLLFTETLRDSPALPFLEACSMSASEQLAAGLIAQPEIHDLVARANQAGVSVYTVHAGGMSPEATRAEIHSARGFQTTVALSTGARDFVLMNDRLAPFAQAARDLSCHYELAYRPPEELKTGRHAVLVKVSGKGRRVRHRSSFSVRTRDEASRAEMMAVLTSPGLYRDLPVEAHGYSLDGAPGSKRRFLLKASVPLSEVALVPGREGRLTGSVSLRGTVVAEDSMRCEFSRTVPLDYPARGAPEPSEGARAGLEAVCDLEPGEKEIVVAARDETGGSLGAFWARTRIEPARRHDGAWALLWGPAGGNVWLRDPAAPAPAAPDGGPLYVRDDFSVSAGEPAAITFLACPLGAGARRDGGPVEAEVMLDGPESIVLPASLLEGGEGGGCRLMWSAIAAGRLPPGRYLVTPRPAAPWEPRGTPVSITVIESDRLSTPTAQGTDGD